MNKTRNKQNSSTIGIVGGVGPYAGLDLNKKIFDQTEAKTDQDHLKVILFSASADISDRTEYLLGQNRVNPAVSIFKILDKLESVGVSLAAIPCNTAHAPDIFDVIIDKLEENGNQIEVVNMIEQVITFLKHIHPNVHNVGILATNGTVQSGLYKTRLEPEGFKVLYPSKDDQLLKIHSSIYDARFGIKANSNPVTETAKKGVIEGIEKLIRRGAECIILGCTELPLAIRVPKIRDISIIDPTLILARALINKVAPEKLKPLT